MIWIALFIILIGMWCFLISISGGEWVDEEGNSIPKETLIRNEHIKRMDGLYH